ncbi:MAG: L-threonylcarbamoyladenylate synthase, partial [Pseudomonadota bacterium]
MAQKIKRRLAPDPTGIAESAEILRNGALLGLPTETVYGLAADAQNETAVAGIFAAKGRPSFNPLIVHVRNLVAAEKFAEFPEDARRLAEALWPGPLTLVLPLREGHGLAPVVTAGLSTVALRVPSHPVALAVLEEFDGPIAAPSANPSGRLSPTRAEHILGGLGTALAGVIDAGPSAHGLESTIIGFASEVALLREGAIAREDIEALLTTPLGEPSGSADQPTSPGQLLRHYAPGVPLRLNATAARSDEIMLGFGEITGDASLSETGDLREAAARLFDCLHALELRG